MMYYRFRFFFLQLKNQNRETTEDMSDSGVMSLTTSDDFCSDGDQHENELVSSIVIRLNRRVAINYNESI